MQFSEFPIESLIPQRPPMVMVGSVLDHTEKSITTSFFVSPDNLFVEDRLFSESGLLENIAQTAAVKVGLACKLAQVPVPIGFIGSINKVTVNQRPKAGATITTFVELTQEVFNITLISAKSMAGDELLVTCQMKIVINP